MIASSDYVYIKYQSKIVRDHEGGKLIVNLNPPAAAQAKAGAL